MKLLQLLLIVAVLFQARSYEVEDEVLVLHDSDFPSILEEFNYILIEFYAPWCGHCQRLAPAYTAAAKALAAKGSKIKLAKVDATKDATSASDYGVQGYPSIFFFINGTKLDFTGDRTEAAIIGWLEKKVEPATSDISSQEHLDKLAEDDSVHLVLYSSDEDEKKQFGLKAASDDYNKYYTAAGDLLRKYEKTTVEIIRKFGKLLTFEGLGDKFASWVAKHSRPLVLDFDDRTIKEIFQKHKSAVILFNKDNSDELKSKVEEVSNEYDGETIFVALTPENEHFDRFAEFIKLDVKTPRLIALKSSEQKKAVWEGDVSAVTADDIKKFTSDLDENKLTLIGMQEADSEKAAAAEEQAEEEAEIVTEEAGGEEL